MLKCRPGGQRHCDASLPYEPAGSQGVIYEKRCYTQLVGGLPGHDPLFAINASFPFSKEDGGCSVLCRLFRKGQGSLRLGLGDSNHKANYCKITFPQ